MHIRILIAIAVASPLASCASGPAFTPGPHLTVAATTELPPPSVNDMAAQGRPYRIGAFDRVSVNVFGVPELSQTVQADASGRVSLPLVGQLEAAGRTPDELARAVEEGLRGRFVRNPQVTVNLEETVSQVITIDGQVREPGLYPVVGRMTLMRAVATAKGTTEFARLDDVVVFRTVGDRQMAALYNLGAIRRGAYPDPELFASDVVVVGDSPGRRLFRDILQAAPLITAPIIAYLSNSN